jgi:hypothetical protein
VSTTHITTCDFCEKNLQNGKNFGLILSMHCQSGALSIDACFECFAKIIDMTKGEARCILQKRFL